MRTVACLLVLFAALPVHPSAWADPWCQFRGAAAGKVPAVKHPMTWSRDLNVAWAAPMEGSGWSSPVVVGDRVFLTYAESADGAPPKGMAAGVASMRSFRGTKPAPHRFVISCLHLETGDVLWDQTVGETTPPVVHPSNTYATESPATDGQRVFTFFATTGTLSAWDCDGDALWRKELGTYPSGNGFGSGSSLATSDGRVYVQYDNDENSFVVAYDAATGEQLWRDDRPAKTSWSTPLIWNNAHRQELVACGADIVTSYDPNDGSVLWRLSGMQSAFSGSPAADSQRIYFGTSGPMSAGPLVAVDAGVDGAIPLDGKFESDRIAWSRTRSGPGMASPVVAGGCLYIPGSGGVLNCYDTETGERHYRTRVPKMKTVVASLWADDERVFMLDEAGTTHIIQTGPEFKLLAANSVDDLVWSSPTIAGEVLLIRGVDNLYCIRDRTTGDELNSDLTEE